MRTLLSYILISMLLFSNVKLSAQSAKVEAEIGVLMQKYEAVGLAVAVVKKGEVIYNHSFGKKNIENNVDLGNADIFRIASISKSFSATAIMQLIDAGKFSLNDDFSNLVGFKIRNPKYPETVITLKMVMSHTSSINDSEGYFNLDVINPDKNVNWPKCYNNYEPGKSYQYCNLNYNMVGTVIEKVSRERFDQYVRHHIIDPLKLYAGYCVDSLDATNFTTLYEYNATTKTFTAAPLAYNPRSEEIKNYTMGYSTPIFSPTGGMKISAVDLARYASMHMFQGKYKDVRVISKHSAKVMQTKISEQDGYGLAIRTVSDLIPGKIMKGHTGSAYGLYSMMFFHPKEKFAIVVITNGCNPIYKDDYNEFLRNATNVLYNGFIK
ncbi:MAG: class A beta-lactamase-related serine hydrolase [Pedobacter sp.]|nr:MAG: class A beta-lactamase-related serine hydrolase [Pedobacter sp.]